MSNTNIINKNFTFMDSKINIYIQDTEQIYTKIEELFKTHFSINNKIEEESSLANIYLKPFNIFNKMKELDKNSLVNKNIIIRTSSIDKFRLSADKYITDTKIIYDCLYSNTVIIMKNNSKDITIYCSENSEIQLIEFIRDLIIKDQEKKGTLVLHAAAFEKNGKGFIISGCKGAGKTTTLMEFLYKNNCKMVSGDKVFLKFNDDELTLRGWPDYTHIGVGTIKRFPQLIKMIKCYGINDIDYRNPNEKILIEPSFFNKHSNIIYYKDSLPLGYILLPEFKDMNKITLKKLKDVSKYIISNLEFKEDYEQAKWHDFIDYRNPKRKYNTNKLINALMNYDAYILKGNLILNNFFQENIL